MGEGHPERPARMDAVEQALQREGFAGRLVRRDAERAALDCIGLMHPQKYRSNCGQCALVRDHEA